MPDLDKGVFFGPVLFQVNHIFTVSVIREQKHKLTVTFRAVIAMVP